MRRRQYLALSTVFLTGCAGGGGSTPTSTATESPTPTEPPTPTETPTPTESPTPSPTPELSIEDVSLPDGVSSDGVSESLVTTHQQRILGEPYTLDMQRTVEWFGTQLTKTTLQIGTNSIHQEQTASGTASKSFWKGPDEGFAQANGGEFYFTVPPQFNRQKVAALDYIRKQVASGDYVPVDAVRQGDSYVIQAEASSATASEGLKEFPGLNLPPVQSIDSYAAMLTITADGLIRNLSLDWTFTDNRGESISEELEYSVSAVGETEVTKPDWLSTARDEAVTFEAQMSDDNKYIVIDLQGGGNLPDNWSFSVGGESGGGHTRSTISAEGGDTVYVGLTEDGEVVVGVNERPGGVKTLSGSVFLHFDINGVQIIDRGF